MCRLLRRYIAVMVIVCAIASMGCADGMENPESEIIYADEIVMDGAKCVTWEFPLENEGAVWVNIPKEYVSKVSQEEIQDIIFQHELKAGDAITIITWNDAASDTETAQMHSEILPPYIYKNYTDPIGSEFDGDCHFLLSAAKGVSTTLGADFEVTIQPTITSGTPYIPLSLGTSFVVRISTTKTFSGPPEASPYNCRSFYCKIRMQEYEWTQERSIYTTLESIRSGTFEKAVGYRVYSIDTVENLP